MLLHSFSMGIGTVFFETAASALFLARFGAAAIPWVYIAAAAVNTLTGLVFSTIRERVSFARLMAGTLAFLLLSIVAFRIGLSLSGAAVLVFGLLVFYRVLSALTDLEFWAVATRLYDVRQAKRLFGVIGSGEVVARIAGAFSVPLLVGAIGVPDLMAFSAGGIASCLVLALVVLRGSDEAARRGPGRGPRRAPRGGALRRSLEAAADPYLRLLLAVTFFAILAKYFVDFAFLEQMKERFGGARALAGFFGIFSGLTQVLSLLARLLASGPVLGRYGIRVGLLVLPLAHAVCTGLVALAGLLPGSGGAVFWLVMANQGIYKTLKHPIDNPSFKVLYQPLKPEQRLAAQITVETIVTPITTGVAGAVMLLFSALVRYDPARFAYVMFAAFAGWVAVARRAGAAYPAALSEALKGRIVDEELSIDDERSLAVVREALASERPGEVVFALDLLERSGRVELAGILIPLLEHPAPEVRASALSRIERLRPPSAVEAVARRVESEDSAPVRAAALTCLCALGGEEAVARVAPYLEHGEAQLRRAALAGLLRHGGGGAARAVRRLSELAASPRAEDRLAAAQVAGEAGGDPTRAALARLVADPAPPVRRAALLSAGRSADPELLPEVVRSLADPAFGGVASVALAGAGAAALPALEAALSAGADGRALARLARVLRRIGGERARELLCERIAFPDERVRDAVLESLEPSGWRAAGPAEQEGVRAAILGEAEDAAWTLAALGDLGESQPLLREALDSELLGSRGRILLLLSFLYEPTAILRARDHLEHAPREKRAYALEILDVTLERSMKDLILPLCEDLPLPARCERLAQRFPQARREPAERVLELLSRPPGRLLPWTRACALYAAGTLDAPGLAEAARRIRAETQDAMVAETAEWTLARLARSGPAPVPEAGQGGARMLTIERVITLKAVPMFSRASEDVLADIAAIVEEAHFAAGETIFAKGEVGDSMYVIVSGRVRVHDGEHTITHLGERDIFGELALLDPEPRVASIQAVEDTRLFRLDREAFSELMAGNIEIVRGVLSVLCERLRRPPVA